MMKRGLLTVFVFALLFGLSSGLSAQAKVVLPNGIPAASQAKINWQQFKGQTVNVLFSNHPWQEAVEPFIPEFEKLTGMKVRLVKLPEAEFHTKVPADFTAGTFAFDVFMSEYFDAAKYQQEKWTADIGPLLKNPKLTDPAWYDWNDFFPAAKDIATVGGKYSDRVAITSEAQVLIYRDDIYQELGLKVPGTLEELLANAKIITEKKPGIAGITLRGGPSMWWPLYGVLKSYGGGYFDKNWNPIINSPQSKAGAAMYVALCQQAPKGVTSYDWDEINTAMLAGKAAMFMDSSVIYSRLADPAQSTVVGKIKMAPFPAGPAGRVGHSHYWSISIAESSKAKPQAWMFLQWVTSKEIMYRAGLTGVLAPRASVWDQPNFTKQFPKDFADSYKVSLKTAVISPAFSRFLEAMDVVRAEMQKAILGDETVDKALDYTQQEWGKIMADWKTAGK
ncbi:MAG: sugar ABC transporter substrate-binding protein [Rectinemataceae bacterium]|jgi:ABC-type glycerol-3-phosphate transport system substrate-binding protein